MKTQMKVTSTNTAGKASTKTFSDVNPEATNLQIKNMGVALIGLTTNTYVKTDRVDTINCDTESDRGV